ncbi:hypothetical protein [Gorillibacterium sp. CAU 1737]|uniref:hypothetical protein n=1 Tax=Gorillibacterium sp. CAU 1737 TaxID=3140362 RepID=UPI0032613FFD
MSMRELLLEEGASPSTAGGSEPSSSKQKEAQNGGRLEERTLVQLEDGTPLIRETTFFSEEGEPFLRTQTISTGFELRAIRTVNHKRGHQTNLCQAA